jgi:hypothetical protein
MLEKKDVELQQGTEHLHVIQHAEVLSLILCFDVSVYVCFSLSVLAFTGTGIQVVPDSLAHCILYFTNMNCSTLTVLLGILLSFAIA